MQGDKNLVGRLGIFVAGGRVSLPIPPSRETEDWKPWGLNSHLNKQSTFQGKGNLQFFIAFFEFFHIITTDIPTPEVPKLEHFYLVLLSASKKFTVMVGWRRGFSFPNDLECPGNCFFTLFLTFGTQVLMIRLH